MFKKVDSTSFVFARTSVMKLGSLGTVQVDVKVAAAVARAVFHVKQGIFSAGGNATCRNSYAHCVISAGVEKSPILTWYKTNAEIKIHMDEVGSIFGKN